MRHSVYINIKPFLFAICLCAGIAAVSALDVPLAKIADDSSLRAVSADSWMGESPDRVLARSPAAHTLPGGGRVEIRAESGNDDFAVIFARELIRGNDGGGGTGQFPGWAQGSWVITRRKDTGAAARIRVFLRSDPYTYIQFRPFTGDKCQMDAVLYDAYIVRSLPIPVTLEKLSAMPLNEVLNLAGAKFPLKYYEPNSDDYGGQRTFITNVREGLKQLQFTDDGAIDAEGRYVYIETGMEQAGTPGLNCSGFAKWLVDGILRPVTGKRLDISELKAPFGDRGSSFTEPWEELRDPFFGLDWIRNLASQAGTALLAPDFGVLEEIEIRRQPFSEIIFRSPSGALIRSYPGFLEDSGYPVEGLLPLLYTLAVDEPGRFYLAAVNTEIGPPSTADNPRGRPRMRQYYHIAALVPYFNEYGVFRVAVFESAAETSINNFITRYPGRHVSLTRVPLAAEFEP